MDGACANPRDRLVAVTIDDDSLGANSTEAEHERRVAIYDLIDENSFAPLGDDSGGPYQLNIALVDQKLAMQVKRESGEDVCVHLLSLSPFRRILKDYFMVCESYRSAVRTSSPAQIEAIDMGRRGLHNEGADLLVTRLKEKIAIDGQTARRLFTLIAALSWKG